MERDASGVSALLGLDGFVVCAQLLDASGEWWLAMETTEDRAWCPSCGVRAVGHGRRRVVVRDLPLADRPVVLVWAKHLWRCPEPACPARTWSEESEHQATLLRVPELRQLSTPAPPPLRHAMATSTRRINTTPPTTHQRVEPDVRQDERARVPTLAAGRHRHILAAFTPARRRTSTAALLESRIYDRQLLLSLRGSRPEGVPRFRSRRFVRQPARCLIRSRRTSSPEGACRPGQGSPTSSPRRQGHG